MLEIIKYIASLFEKASPALTSCEVHPDTTARVVALKSGYTIAELPKGRASAPTRTHLLADTASFIAWLKRYARADTAEIFSDQKAGKLVAICGTAWTADTVTCAIALDPMFAQLIASTGRTLTQEGLRALLSTLRAYLAETNAIGQISTFEAKTSGEVTSHIDKATGARKLRLVSAGVEYPIELPPELHFTIPVYEGGPPMPVTLTLCPSVEQGKMPTFALTWPEQALVLADAFRGEVGRVREGLGEGWLVMLGTGARA